MLNANGKKTPLNKAYLVRMDMHQDEGQRYSVTGVR
jgi:hypothetical protein